MDWRLRGAIDRALGLVPGGRRIHARLAQRSVDLGALVDLQVDDWHVIAQRLDALDIAITDARIVELGAGSCPTIAACMYLAGAAKVFSLDGERRQSAELVRELADRLVVHASLIARDSGRALDEITALQGALSHAVGRGTPLLLASDMVIDYRAPVDAAQTALPAASVDLVVSRSVLEHQPPARLVALFAEARRILRPGGAMVHLVDTADHYARGDSRRGPLDYLAVGDAEWSRWNTAFMHQNRLRASDFAVLAREAGFADVAIHARRRASLEGITLAPQFQAYPPDDVAITSCELVAR
ncbi:MAG: methyltransferase domain-containing protein [Deltaproteobacteria bacterium]|nr:methyltransferase domain-containing protein [Deltaproteobacteria bacterium]